MKEQENTKQTENKSQDQFEIKNPKWTFWTCILGAVIFPIAFFVCLYLKKRGMMSSEDMILGYFFLALSIGCVVGVYCIIYEKLAYSDRVYKYYRPFGKNQFAAVDDIARVKILTVYYYTKGGMRDKIRIFFYDKKNNVLIKIIDDGTISKNKDFLKSLSANHIRLVREEKYDE